MSFKKRQVTFSLRDYYKNGVNKVAGLVYYFLGDCSKFIREYDLSGEEVDALRQQLRNYEFKTAEIDDEQAISVFKGEFEKFEKFSNHALEVLHNLISAKTGSDEIVTIEVEYKADIALCRILYLIDYIAEVQNDPLIGGANAYDDATVTV